MIGQTIGHYRVLEKLGEGGMGEVYLAEDQSLDRRVALKFLSENLRSDDIARQRFVREAKSAAALDHPFICKIFDAGHADGHDYIAMEYVSGTTLKEKIAQGPLPLDEFFRLAGEVTEALEEAHSRRIIHRDLKPANIMFTAGGHIKVMDFGLAKRLTEQAEIPTIEPTLTLTRRGTAVGTLAYMAPEQIAGAEADARTDIFSLGVVFYEAMVGQHPFRKPTVVETVGAILREDPPPLRERNPEIPERLETAIRRMTAKDPAGRRQTIVEVRTDLAEALEDAQRQRRRTRPREERTAVRAPLGSLEGIRPYPGLAAFTTKQADFFYGRETEVEMLWTKLQRSKLLGLIGATGSGKSSFLRAGLIPAAPKGWGIVIATPGNRPFTQLGQELAGELAGDTEAIRKLVLIEASDDAVAVISRWRKRHEQGLLILDQFEELFTLNPEETQRNFAGLLGRVVDECDVHVLLSMRDDFLMRCHGFEELEPIFADLTPLSAPTGSALRRALVEPAARFGYEFEDESLVEGMLESVTGERGALPMLAFAASELWDRRDPDDGLLTREAYDAIGGVSGALAKHAEATLERIGSERQVIVREIFRNLVTAQGTRAVIEKEELLSAFPERESAEEVLGLLIDARLLTSYEVTSKETGKSSQRIEVVHESLLKAWPRLVHWQKQDEEGALLRDQLRQAARLWAEKGKTQDLLWTGTAYQEFSLWRERYPGSLTAVEDEFARSMAERARRKRRLVRVSVVAAFLVVLAVAGTVTVLWQQAMDARDQAQTEARRAEGSKLLALAQLRLEKDPTEALAYATASLELADTEEARLFAVKVLAEGPPAFEFEPGIANSFNPAFSPTGKRLAVAGATTEGAVWDQDGSLLCRLPGLVSNPNVNYPSWVSEDLVAAGLGNYAAERVRLFAVPEGHEVRAIDLGAPSEWQVCRNRLFAESFRTTPEGRQVKDLRSWDLADGKESNLGSIESAGPGSPHGVFTPNGEGYYHAKGSSLFLLPLPVGTGPDVLVSTHPGGIAWFSFLGSTRWNNWGTDSRKLWVQQRDGLIRIWNHENSTLRDPIDIPKPLTAPPEVDPDPSGKWVWRQPYGNTNVRIWPIEALPGARPLTLRRDSSWYATTCDFHPSGKWLVCSTAVGSRITLWPLPDRIPMVVDGYSSLQRPVVFSPDSRWLATSWEDGGLRLWPVPGYGARETVRFDVQTEFMWTGLAFDPGGRFLFAAGNGGNAVIIPMDGSPIRRLDGFGEATMVGQAVAVSPSGRFVAAAVYFGTEKKTLRVWEVETGAVREFPLPLREPPPDSPPGEPSGYEGAVYRLFFQGDSVLFTAGEEGVYRWDLDAGEPALAWDQWRCYIWPVGDGPLALVASSSKYLPAGDDDFEAVWVDLATGESRPAEELDAFPKSFKTIVVGGVFLVGAGSDGLLAIAPITGGSPHILVGHGGPRHLWNVAISPDLKWVASTGEDNTLRLWPMPDLSKPPLYTLPHDELIAKLKSLTNLRAVPDPEAENGWKIELGPFPGWKEVPAW